VAEAFEWALFEFMRPTFTAHLAEALPLFVRSGFGPFEQTWARGTFGDKDLLVPKKLGLRLPRSVYRWMQDDDGDLTAIEQLVLGKGMVTLPAQDLVYYRVGAEGDNWEGTSMLRPAYKHWYIKDQVERFDALAQQREAMGIPVVYPPANRRSDDVSTTSSRPRQAPDGRARLLRHARPGGRGRRRAPAAGASRSKGSAARAGRAAPARAPVVTRRTRSTTTPARSTPRS
jgi:hypothetical protein